MRVCCTSTAAPLGHCDDSHTFVSFDYNIDRCNVYTINWPRLHVHIAWRDLEKGSRSQCKRGEKWTRARGEQDAPMDERCSELSQGLIPTILTV